MIIPIGSSHLHKWWFVYTSINDVFQCLGSKNERNIVAFSKEKMYTFSYSVYFGVPPVHRELGWKKRYILRTASTYHMYENIFYKIYSLRIYRKIYRICREWKCILVLYTQLSWNLKKIDISNINNSNYRIAYIKVIIAHMSNAIDHWVWDTWVWLYPFKKSTYSIINDTWACNSNN